VTGTDAAESHFMVYPPPPSPPLSVAGGATAAHLVNRHRLTFALLRMIRCLRVADYSRHVVRARSKSMTRNELVTPPPPGATQQKGSAMPTSGWRYCGKCHALFWDGDANKGRCAAGGGHQSAGYRFVLPSNQAESRVGQINWRHCGQCRVLFFNGYPEKGACAASGAHSATTPDFLLNHDVPVSDTAQGDWRYCGKCHGLYFDGYRDKGRCPAGAGHAAAGWNFVLAHAPEPTHGFGDDNVGIPV
jgi:hypothetical protein